MFSVGLWMWEPPVTRPEWWEPVLERFVEAKIGHLTLKVSDGLRAWNGDHLAPVFARARDLGLHTWAWAYCRDTENAMAQGNLVGTRAAALAANGVILDLEADWRPHDPQADPLVAGVRAAYGGPVWVSSYSTMSLHPEFPWTAFARLVDGFMPQVYQRPQDEWARRAYREFNALSRGVMLTGIGSDQMGTANDTRRFLAACRDLDVPANLWEASQLSAAMWEVVCEATGGRLLA